MIGNILALPIQIFPTLNRLFRLDEIAAVKFGVVAGIVFEHNVNGIYFYSQLDPLFYIFSFMNIIPNFSKKKKRFKQKIMLNRKKYFNEYSFLVYLK